MVRHGEWRFSTRAKWRYCKTHSVAEFVYLDNAVVVIDGMTPFQKNHVQTEALAKKNFRQSAFHPSHDNSCSAWRDPPTTRRKISSSVNFSPAGEPLP